jgi:hypothetical protein
MRTMAAGRFKATCLAVMDEVQAKREPVVITKNGKAGGEDGADRDGRGSDLRVLQRKDQDYG